ncbi:MAG: 5'/3'-nucleotidase SurE [Bacillota bacterium]
MKILVTNDDGVFAEGIYKLAVALSTIGNVTVVAPDRQRSATGHAITMHDPIRAEKVRFFDTMIEAWSVSGTPADCVKLGIEVLIKEKPDIVFSGINRGPNLGTDVLYSGTVSAAIEGSILGVPAVAVSLAAFKDTNYDPTASFCCLLAKKMMENKLPAETLLNVNVPNCKEHELKGVDITILGVRKYQNSFIERIDPRGQTYYWMGGELVEIESEKGTDVYSIQNNKISVTPIHFDLTKFDLIKEIEGWHIPLREI